MRGAIAGAVVALGAAVAAWWIWSDGGTAGMMRREAASAKRIADVGRRGGDSIRKTVAERDVLPVPRPSGRRIETREDIPAPQPLEEMKAALTNRPPRKAAFTNAAEQLIAMATPSFPGASVPPLPNLTEADAEKAFRASQRHVLSAQEDDSEAVLEKKIVVAGAKEEFAELRESEGWTFVEYLNALRDKANDDAGYMAEAHKVIDEIYHDQTVSDEDYVKYRDQVNEKLRERGLPEIDKEEENEDEGK